MRVTIDVASHEFVINGVTISYFVNKGYLIASEDERIERITKRMLKRYGAIEDPDSRYGYIFMWSTELYEKIRINCVHMGKRWQATSVKKATLGFDADSIISTIYGSKLYEMDYYCADLPSLKVTVLE